MPVLHYKHPITGEWLPIVSGPRGPEGPKGDPGGVVGPPGADGATTHAALTDLGLQNDDHPQYYKSAGDNITGVMYVDDAGELIFREGGVNKFKISNTGDFLSFGEFTGAALTTLFSINRSTKDFTLPATAKLKNNAPTTNTGVTTFSAATTFSAGASMGDKKITNVLTPTAADDAANKAYVDGIGGIMGMLETVAPGSANHWLNGVGAPLLWGGMTGGADYLMSQKAGWYRCSFNGTFATNTTGSIREMRLAINGPNDSTEIPGSANHIGASVTPKSWSGWGLNLSASGIWHMPVGKVIRLMARHDATASLQCSATITMQLVKAD